MLQRSVYSIRSFTSVNGSGFKDLACCLVSTGVKLGSKNFDIAFSRIQLPYSRTLQKMHNTELERFVSGLQPLLEKDKVS